MFHGPITSYVKPIQQTWHQKHGQASDVEQRGENQEDHGLQCSGREGDYFDGEINAATKEDAGAEEEEGDG